MIAVADALQRARARARAWCSSAPSAAWRRASCPSAATSSSWCACCRSVAAALRGALRGAARAAGVAAGGARAARAARAARGALGRRLRGGSDRARCAVARAFRWRCSSRTRARARQSAGRAAREPRVHRVPGDRSALPRGHRAALRRAAPRGVRAAAVPATLGTPLRVLVLGGSQGAKALNESRARSALASSQRGRARRAPVGRGARNAVRERYRALGREASRASRAVHRRHARSARRRPTS